jgi:hypothetical protein
VSALQRAVETAARERAALADELAKLEAERAALDSAPLPKSDMQAQLFRYLDTQGERFTANLERGLELVHRKPQLNLAELQSAFPLLTPVGGSALDERLVAAAFSDALKAQIRASFEAMEWPDAGPPLAQRATLRARLDRQIADVRSRLTAADETAHAAGVQLNGR